MLKWRVCFRTLGVSITKLFYAENRRRSNSLHNTLMGEELDNQIEIALDVTFVDTQRQLFFGGGTYKIIYGRNLGNKIKWQLSKWFPGASYVESFYNGPCIYHHKPRSALKNRRRYKDS